MARQQLPGLFGRGRPDLLLDPFFSLRSEIDRLFEDFGRAPALRASIAPKIDVSETETAIEILAELPGVKDSDLDLSIEENAILLRGERREEREERQRNWHVQERTVGSFARRIELPFAPSPDEVRARFENGVLAIVIPKPQQPGRGARRIQIEAGRQSGGGPQPPQARMGGAAEGGGAAAGSEAGPAGLSDELGEGAGGPPQGGGGGPG